jgi:tRNA-specific 2-thiouridylase
VHWIQNDLALANGEGSSITWFRLDMNQPLQKATLQLINAMYIEFEEPQSAITGGDNLQPGI